MYGFYGIGMSEDGVPEAIVRRHKRWIRSRVDLMPDFWVRRSKLCGPGAATAMTTIVTITVTNIGDQGWVVILHGTWKH